MLRPTIARKVLRLRAARMLAPRYNSDTPTSRVATKIPPPVDPSKFPLYRPPPPPEEDAEGISWSGDVEDLPTDEAIKREIKRRVTNETIKSLPEFSEEDLRDFYKNLVLAGKKDMIESLPQIEAPKMTPKQRKQLLENLVQRLEAPRAEAVGELQGEQAATERPAINLPAIPKNLPTHVALTSTLLHVGQEESTSSFNVPLGLVTQSEWQALLDTFILKGDGNGAEVLLSTMERHGVRPSLSQVDQIAELYANRGMTSEVMRYINDLDDGGIEVTDHHRDLVIQSLLGGEKPDVKGAIDLLKQSEKLGKPFPQTSYNLVLQNLSNRSADRLPNAEERSMAWDLFAQMRFAAHPTPTREVYTTMIKACADPREPQPERARDLWIEMTVDQGVEPSGDEFNAIIAALGSTKADYLESFDLMRQMLAKHNEATWEPFSEAEASQSSPWVPTLETFNALLEGAKRAGDLDRARWVLNEVVDLARSSLAFGRDAIQSPNEETMASVFMTYASWKPVKRRANVALARPQSPRDVTRAAEQAAKAAEAEASGEESGEGSAAGSSQREGLVEDELDPTRRPSMPETSAAALLEVDALLAQCLHDYQATQGGAVDPYTVPFGKVRPTARLLNAFITAHFVHGKGVEATRAVYDGVWARVRELFPALRVRPNGWTYLEIMQKCGRGRMSPADAKAARAWGAVAWDEYRAWFKEAAKQVSWENDPRARRQRWLLGLDDRQTERIWAAGIKLATMRGDVDGALSMLLEFAERYPAADILRQYTPRVPGEFAVRLSDPRLVPESNIPPHILFKDIAVLHQRCAIDENADGLRKIKWVTTAYANNLAKRKRWRLHGGGVKRELAKLQKKGDRIAPPAPEEDADEEETHY